MTYLWSALASLLYWLADRRAERAYRLRLWADRCHERSLRRTGRAVR